MLRIRISLPITVEQDKVKLDKCCEILTSYFMNKFETPHLVKPNIR